MGIGVLVGRRFVADLVRGGDARHLHGVQEHLLAGHSAHQIQHGRTVKKTVKGLQGLYAWVNSVPVRVGLHKRTPRQLRQAAVSVQGHLAVGLGQQFGEQGIAGLTGRIAAEKEIAEFLETGPQNGGFLICSGKDEGEFALHGENLKRLVN